MGKLRQKIEYAFSEVARTRRFWAMRKKAIELKKKGRILSAYFLRLRCNSIMRRYGCNIPYSAQFEDKPIFPHQMYGIFVSTSAKTALFSIR